MYYEGRRPRVHQQHFGKMQRLWKQLTRKAVINHLLLLSVWVWVYLLTCYASVPLRGFFCNDASLQFPYYDDTVSTTNLYRITLAVPAIGILMYAIAKFKKGTMSLKLVHQEVCILMLGLGVIVLMTVIIKYSTGRLRPHFFDVCRPDWSTINCSHGYVTNYTCLGTNQKRLGQMRVSFLSGHASLVCFGVGFFLVYLKLRQLQNILPKYSVVLLRGISVCVALATCISRVMDNKHHVTDVIAGAALGSVIGLLTAKMLPQTEDDVREEKKKT